MKRPLKFCTIILLKTNRQNQRGPMNSKDIALAVTNKDLSANTGLIFFNKIFEDLNLSKRLTKILPGKKRNRGPSQVNKFKSLLFAFAAGADSLSDVDELDGDKLFLKLTDGGVASRTMGDFLRSLKPRKIELLQDLLIDMAITLRISAYADRDFILSMDSTPHEHYGKKMEGMSWNYKNYWCLDSQNAYDQYGFSYLFDLRPGKTHSGKDSELWIRKIFSRIAVHNLNKYFRADSAYGKHTVYAALKAAEVKFTIVLKDSVAKHVRKLNKNLLEWKKSDLYFFDSNECELASCQYPIKQLGNLRVVMIRRAKKNIQLDIFDEPEALYDYYSIITNMGLSEKSDKDIIEFYRGRGNAENFIKEQKYGFDFLNFPCKKLDANKVYGLVGTFCHNMMRYLSFCLPQKTKKVRGKDKEMKTVVQMGYFAKKVRNSLIKLPCQVVCHARKIILKMNQHTKEVFEKVMTKINFFGSLPTD